MFQKLSKYLARPVLFERTKDLFWNDPYIAKQMLEAHLNPHTDGASRNHRFISRSVQWIASLVPKKAAILDLGCGPGLYTKPLSEMGFHVTGMDLSANSIDYARSQDRLSRYIHQNYLTLDKEEEYDMILMIYHDYGALIPSERQLLISNVYRALKPGGKFLLDVGALHCLEGQKENTSWEIFPDGGFWSRDPHICMNAHYYYQNNISLRCIVVLEEDHVKQYNLYDTCFTRSSLSAEITASQSFSETGCYDDAAGTVFSGLSDTICMIFKKRGLEYVTGTATDSR